MDRTIELTDDFFPVTSYYKTTNGRYVGVLWVMRNPDWGKLNIYQTLARAMIPVEMGEVEPVLLLDSSVICLS